MYKMGAHLAKRADLYFAEDRKAAVSKILKSIEAIAKDVGVSQTQLALAWSIATSDTTTAILGFSRTSQIDENLGAI